MILFIQFGLTIFETGFAYSFYHQILDAQKYYIMISMDHGYK